VDNPSGVASWHGPYLRRTAAGDTAGYLLDGWGHPYTYNQDEGTISSLGNGKFPMTVRVADSLAQLYFNKISGTITDADGNPPGIKAMGIMTVTFYYNNGDTNQKEVVLPDAGGYYEFSPDSPHGVDTVPIGIHKMVAAAPGMDTLTRWVTVVPRSHTVVDFKFSQLFRNQLKMVGPAVIDGSDSAGFLVRIVNTGTVDATITMLEFIDTPESAYMRDFHIDGNPGTGFPKLPGDYGTGPKDTVSFAPVTIAPHMTQQVDLLFQHFFVDSAGPSAVPPNDTNTVVVGKVFRFRFDDGSEIIARP